MIPTLLLDGPYGGGKNQVEVGVELGGELKSSFLIVSTSQSR